MMRGRWFLAAIVVCAAILGACESPDQTAKTTPTPEQIDPFIGKKLYEVLPGPDVALEIGYAAAHVGNIRDGLEPSFTWRQTAGQRRWDLTWALGGDRGEGTFAIEGNFSDVSRYNREPDSKTITFCGWGKVSSQDTALLDCTNGYIAVFQVLTQYWAGELSKALEPRNIAGRTAACYELGGIGIGAGYACFDPASHALLSFAGVDIGRNEYSEINATYIYDDGRQPTIVLPAAGPGSRIQVADIGLPSAVLEQLAAPAGE